MDAEHSVRRVLLISGIVALLLMAFLFDFITVSLQMRNSEGAGFEPLLIILFPVFALVLVLTAMVLLKYLTASATSSRAMPLAYLITGLAVLLATPLLFFLPFPIEIYNLVQFVQPGSFAFQAGALLAGAGILSLNRKAPSKPAA